MVITDFFDISAVSGLRPTTWLCVGHGLAREEVKQAILQEGFSLTDEAVTSLEDLCLKILQKDSERVLDALGRQEVLRLLLAEPKISLKFDELKRLKRQRGFFKKIDKAVQAGRLAFAHPEEQSVYGDRLNERFEKNILREEVAAFGAAFEVWLQAMDLYDRPLLLKNAVKAIEEKKMNVLSHWPDKLVYLSVRTPESSEKAFLDMLSRITEVQLVSLEQLLDRFKKATKEQITIERWHTLDDSAEVLADSLTDWIRQNKIEGFNNCAVLIPDMPFVRRTLLRALAEKGLPLAEPRDPSRLRWDENIKAAVLPLELIATNFERRKVAAWVRVVFGDSKKEWISEINSRGIRNGLSSYEGGKLVELHASLSDLKQRLGARSTVGQLAKSHLQLLKEKGQLQLAPFFQKVWQDLEKDVRRIGLEERRAHCLYWFERLSSRLEQLSPPVEKEKPEYGVKIYRLAQAPLRRFEKVWIIGIPSNWLSMENVADYWFNEREREILASEFAVRSSIQARIEKTGLLKAWLAAADSVSILDCQYDWDGREREALIAVFRELGLELKLEEKGSHSRFIRSYDALRPVPPQKLSLGPLTGKTTVHATEIDKYSACPFSALAASRWKLRDVRQPDAELWGDVRGTILHTALKILISSRSGQGEFSISVKEAINQAWSQHTPRGLFRSEKLLKYTREKLEKVLQTFCEKEKEYVLRAQTIVHSLEGPELRLKIKGVDVVGVPDRIDEHKEGFFILDYKTSSALPRGKEMVGDGYRLQLPFYAIAAEKVLRKPVIGVQFVQLNRKGARTNGIYFRNFNGKESGKLTNSRSKLNLFETEPADAWEKCEEHLLIALTNYVQGLFSAEPKKAEDCRACAYQDLCGKRRAVTAGLQND